jgi:hypothetical protein
LVTIPFFALSLGFYGLAFYRSIGRFAAFFALALVLVTIQFITVPIVPTVTCSAFWFSGPALYLLTGPLQRSHVPLLSLLVAASLFTYPAGSVTILPLLGLHLLLFRSSWDRQRLVLLFTSMTGSLGVVWVVRQLVETKPNVLHWGIQKARFSLDPYLSAIDTTLREVFVATDSWYAFSGRLPYLAPELSVLLLSSVILAVASLRRGAEGAKPRLMSPVQRRWLTVFLLSFVGAVALACLVPKQPGVRRIFPATLLLLPVAAIPLQVLADRGGAKRVAAWVLAAAFVVGGAWRSHDVTERLSLGVRNRNRPFVEAAADILATDGAVDRVLFVSSSKRHVPQFDACVLHFSKRSRGSFGSVEAFRLRDDGVIKTAMRRPRGQEARDFPGSAERIAVFADRELPKEALDRLLGGQAYRFTQHDLSVKRAFPSRIFAYRSQADSGSARSFRLPRDAP